MIASVIAWLTACSACRTVALALAVAGAFWGYTLYAEQKGEARVSAAVAAATAKESARRTQVIAAAQTAAQQAVRQEAAARARNRELEQQIAKLSAANDRRTCLDRAAVGRLRAIGGHAAGR